MNLPNSLRYYSGSESSDSIRSLNLKGVEILSKETMAQNASHIVTDRFTSLTAEKLNKKVPPPLLITPTSSASSNKKRHVVDYATDHLFRPIKPKPTWLFQPPIWNKCLLYPQNESIVYILIFFCSWFIINYVQSGILIVFCVDSSGHHEVHNINGE